MANSNCWGELEDEAMNTIDVIATSEVIATSDIKDWKEDSEMEEGLHDLEVLPDIVMSLREPIDVNSHMAVTESWANSMEEIDRNPPDAQKHTYNTDSTSVNQEDTDYEQHNFGRYRRESTDTRRLEGRRAYVDQPRANNRRNFRGREFEGGFRGQDFRGVDLRRRGCRGRGRGYRNGPRFMSRGPPISHPRCGTDPGWGRHQISWDRNDQFWRPNAQ